MQLILILVGRVARLVWGGRLTARSVLSACCRMAASSFELAFHQSLAQLCQEGDDALGRELRAADPLAAQRMSGAREQVRVKVLGSTLRCVCSCLDGYG